MPFRTPVARTATVLVLALCALFGTAAIVITVRGGGATTRAAITAPPQSALNASSYTATMSTLPTVPPTTEPPKPSTSASAPAPEPEPTPPPELAQRSGATTAAAAAPAPSPPPAVVASSCQALSAGSLLAAHQTVHPFAVDGGLNAGAQTFAFTLCNAHTGDNLFHSGQAGGENVASIYSSGGCMNDGNLIVQLWLGSPGHRANLMNSSVVGGGVACDGNTTYFVAQYR